MKGGDAMIQDLLMQWGVPSLVLGFCFGVLEYKLKKRDQQHEEERKALIEEQNKKDKQRSTETLLLMELTNANTDLTIGVAMALKNGHANGEIEEGLAAVQAAKQSYQRFHNEIVSEQLH
jgi:hypothetical protein